MANIPTIKLNASDVERLLALREGHFVDLKAIEVAPAKLTRTVCAMANAEGGDVYIGVDDSSPRIWRGFRDFEDANGHIQIFEQLFPLGNDFQYEFWIHPTTPSVVLRIQVAKTREIKKAADSKVYVRRGAQNLAVETPEKLEILRRDKGISSFETETVDCPVEVVSASDPYREFLKSVVPRAEPIPWLRKQLLINADKPTVAAVLLFAEEPQAVLPKRCGLKLYRYKTTAEKGTRETLESTPATIEGCAYSQIHHAVAAVTEKIQSISVRTAKGIAIAKYPHEAIHEILTNAVIHRDYAIPDDIHIRLFDNRIEVASPGVLPGHITVDNILDERFARNPSVVRLLNKFPDPPNKVVGEGLNTAFESMQKMRLKPPVITQEGGYVLVTLRHESLATPEESILTFLLDNHEIANRDAREICYIPSENKMKRVLQNMVKSQLIESIPGRTGYSSAYTITEQGRAVAENFATQASSENQMGRSGGESHT